MEIAKQYPYPVASPYSIILDETNTYESRPWAIHFSLYQALKLVTLPVLTQYLTSEIPLKEMDRKSVQKINGAIGRIRCPFFSDWITLVYSIRKNVNEDKLGFSPIFPVKESLAAVKKEVKAFSEDFERLRWFPLPNEIRDELRDGTCCPTAQILHV